tara:strand:- start:218 stop:505 length:288 start_codon:yes stop_codon:yes gene_type:complete
MPTKHYGLMDIEIEFEFTETHPAIGIGYDKSGQAIDPPAPPEWELDGFNLGQVEVNRKEVILTRSRSSVSYVFLANEIEKQIEEYISQNYNELTK